MQVASRRSDSFRREVAVKGWQTGPFCHILPSGAIFSRRQERAGRSRQSGPATLDGPAAGTRRPPRRRGGLIALVVLYIHPPSAGKLIHNLLCDGRVKNDCHIRPREDIRCVCSPSQFSVVGPSHIEVPPSGGGEAKSDSVERPQIGIHAFLDRVARHNDPWNCDSPLSSRCDPV